MRKNCARAYDSALTLDTLNALTLSLWGTLLTLIGGTIYYEWEQGEGTSDDYQTGDDSEAGAEAGADASDYENFLAAIKYAYSRAKGAKKENLRAKRYQPLARRLYRAWQELGEAEFLTRLNQYLDNRSPSLVRARWPLARFLHWLTGGNPAPHTSLPPRQPATTPKTQPQHQTQPPVQNLDNSPQPTTTRQQFLERWEQTVKTGTPVRWQHDWDQGFQDQTFQANIDRLIELCARLVSGNKIQVSVAWLFRGKTPNWVRLLNGDYDWALGQAQTPTTTAQEPETQPQQEPNAYHPAWALVWIKKAAKAARILVDRGQMSEAKAVFDKYGVTFKDPTLNIERWQWCALDLIDLVVKGQNQSLDTDKTL